MLIEELENIKLLRELNYLKSEFEYKNSLVELYNIDFRKWVDKILNINSELKYIFEENIEKNTINFEEDNKDSIETLNTESTKIKNFYRRIVKLTHPDKIKNDSLNTIYNQANIAFKENNSIEMLLICDRLGLQFDLTEEEKKLLISEISDLRNKILLIESTYPYQWAINNDENVKNSIALNYIRNSII